MTVGMRGIEKSDSPKMAIYLDNPSREEDIRHKPGTSRMMGLLRWLLARMSVSENDVLITFTLKCHKGKEMTKKNARLAALDSCSYHRREELNRFKSSLKAIVVMGGMGAEAFLGGKQLKNVEGANWQPHETFVSKIVNRVWFSYSPAYADEKPAETPALYRVIWTAAVEAGLKPKHNPNVKPFDFDL